MVTMIETTINNRWTLLLPEHRAARPEWGQWVDDQGVTHEGWEVERLDSLYRNVGPGDVVFDIGSEEGDISGLLASWIGPGDGGIVLFEANDKVWANTFAIWEANNLKTPLAFVQGFASDFNRHLDLLDIDHWPDAIGGPIVADHGFVNTFERPEIPAIRIDDFVGMCGRMPTILHIDVEGAEGLVLDGCIDTLREAMPLVYVSLHPEFSKAMYDRDVQEIYDYLGHLGYRSKVLAVDHETHLVAWHPHGRELRH